jgi:hypothetical protein
MSAQLSILGKIEQARAEEIYSSSQSGISVCLMIDVEQRTSLTLHLYDLESIDRLLKAAHDARNILAMAIERERFVATRAAELKAAEFAPEVQL